MHKDTIPNKFRLSKHIRASMGSSHSLTNASMTRSSHFKAAFALSLITGMIDIGCVSSPNIFMAVQAGQGKHGEL